MLTFLIDNPLLPRLAEGLRDAGYDAIHVRQIGMHAASDQDILLRALREDPTVISSDTDFGKILFISKANKPSVILFRGGTEGNKDKQLALLLPNLPALHSVLDRGCVVVFTESHMRIRLLPIGAEGNGHKSGINQQTP